MRELVAINLTLTIGSKQHDIPGGNVRGLSVRLTSWGVEGWVEFVLQDDRKKGGKYEDKLLADFVSPDLAEVTLSMMPGHLETRSKAADAAIVTGGVALEKSLREEVTEGPQGTPSVLFRRYRVAFADPARALWRQHFPCALYTKKSFKDVIDAHRGAKISVAYDWDVLSAETKLISFHLGPGHGASFYDLVVNYVREHNGALTYDHAARTYTIAKARKTAAQPASLPEDDVLRLTSHWPAPVRHSARVLNCDADSPSTAVAQNAHAVDGVHHDVLVRTRIADDVDGRLELERARPSLPPRELELELRRFPTVPVWPGRLLEISAKGGHSADLLASGGTLCVDELSIEGRADDDGPEASYGEDGVALVLEMTARLSPKDDPRVPLPATSNARFPWYVEGKVVSEIGEDSELTCDFVTDDDTSLTAYRIRIPLFDDQEIQVVHEPATGAGNLYLPLYKGQRVLVALELHSARFDRLLDWRPEAKLGKDLQGQQLFLGKSAKSHTCLRHEYEAEKPVLRMQRTNDKDTVLFRLEEGKLTLKVEEQEA